MAKQTVNIGTSANKGNGDPLRTAFTKINNNFDELYSALGNDGDLFDPSSVDQSLVPTTTNTVDLGSASKQWRSLYVSNNTIYIGGVAIAVDNNGNLTAGGTVVGSAPAWASITGKPTFATVATTGAYVDLTGKPTIPTSFDRLSNNGDEVILIGGANPYVTFPAITGGDQLQIQGAEVSSVSGSLALTSQDNLNIIANGSGAAPGGSKNWTFGDDGSLTIPGDIKSENAINIDINLADSTLRRWRFGEDGGLTFPDGSLALTDSILNNGLDADLKGSVFADDSTIMVDAVSNKIYTSELTFSDGTTTVGKTITVPEDEDFNITLQHDFSDGAGPLPFSFSVSWDRITLLNGNGKIITGSTAGNNEWALDASNKNLSFPNNDLILYNGSLAGEGLDYGLRLFTYTKPVIVTSGQTQSWTFGTDGNLTLPGDIHGAPVISGGAFPSQVGRTVNITPADDASDKKFKFRIDQYGETFTRAYLEFPTAEVDKQVAAVFPHTNGKAGYIYTQGADTNGQGMNDAFNIFYNNGDIKITSMGSSGGLYTWKFGDTGNLTLPGDIKSEGNINIDINLSDSTLRRWRFGEDGDLDAPGSILLKNGARIKDTTGNAVAFGENAGLTNQGNNATAVGSAAGSTNQGASAVAVGLSAGFIGQGASTVAVGNNAAQNSQATGAVALGTSAGELSQGTYAVALGAFAGRASQAANSIVINASGVDLNNTTASSFVVKPVRAVSGASLPSGFKPVAYNPTTGEFIYYDA